MGPYAFYWVLLVFYESHLGNHHLDSHHLDLGNHQVFRAFQLESIGFHFLRQLIFCQSEFN